MNHGVRKCEGAIGDHEITAMAFYNDTLHIGFGSDVILDDRSITGIARSVAPAFPNHCSGNVSVAALNDQGTARMLASGGGHYRVDVATPNEGITFKDVFGRRIAHHA